MEDVLALRLAHRMGVRRSILTDAVLVILGSLFVAAMAQVFVLLPFSPVPVTGQTFAVLLVGIVLGSRRGGLSLSLYLFEGLIGLPFFAGGASGPARLLGPTGGYLIGFVAAAVLVGYLAGKGFDRRWGTALLAFVAGEGVIFLFGVSWLSLYIGVGQAVTLGFLPFVIGDLVKVFLASAALPSAWALVNLFER